MGGVFVWYDTTMETRSKLEQRIWKGLANVIDPELGIDIVSLGLIYKVVAPDGVTPPKAHITMTLTTPGCPLAHVFEDLVKQQLLDIPDFDPYRDLAIDLVFDPPWVQDMMTDEAKAELGFE
jgi:metal-sulfur cluster biosynthetic enzyme